MPSWCQGTTESLPASLIQTVVWKTRMSGPMIASSMSSSFGWRTEFRRPGEQQVGLDAGVRVAPVGLALHLDAGVLAGRAVAGRLGGREQGPRADEPVVAVAGRVRAG